ncbi:MAG: SpoIVB peptidase [Phycisphaerales bacterium]|nr:SpoIVB peptidase [Phycisphaerales bacterium]
MRSSRALVVALASMVAPIPSCVQPASVQAELPPARTAPPPATQPQAAEKSLFDPARHIRVSEVKAGMTGYGLTVFRGSKIERFDIEVLSVLRNFNPKGDVVLIRCKGDYLEHTGSIAGMSGSPVYLTDAAGHARMLGAFAYGWPMTKDPVAGVQPIEYMLELPVKTPGPAQIVAPDAGAAEGAGGAATPTGRHGGMCWSLKDAGMLPMAWKAERRPWLAGVRSDAVKPAHLLGGADNPPRLEPLATPLMTAGLSPRVLDQLAPQFRAAGLTALQAGGGSGAENADVKLEPGSVLAVPLLTGDVEMTAVGTCTEVLGDHVWGFGHPFNNEGPVALPMGAGEINGVIANLNTSFKLGAMSRTAGTITTDGSVGVAGAIGAAPPTVPIELTVHPADGSHEKTYHFNASQHPKLTPMIAGAAFSAAVSGTSELPQYNTVDYDVSLTFSNGQTVRLANRSVNATANDLFGDAGVVLQAASDNPFQRVAVKKITGSISVRPRADAAVIQDVNLPKSRYHPGDVVKAYVSYQPFRGAEAMLPVELELPRDLAAGTYQLIISDAMRYFSDQQTAEPFRFTAENVGDVFAVLKDVATIRENAVYLRLLRKPDGIAVGHTALPRLPSSRRQILLGAGRSNTTPFVSSTVKSVPTELVMTGSAEFAITIETTAKVSVGAPHPAKPEPAFTPAAKAEEARKPGAGESPGKKDAPKESPKQDAPKEAKPGE